MYRLFLGLLLSTAWGASLSTGLAQPANDDFANAIEITGPAGNVVGDNLGATSELNEPAHFGYVPFASVWYRWTAPTNGLVSFDTIGSGFDTILAVYTGDDFSAMTPVASDDDSGGNFNSRVAFQAVAGTVYHIVVDGFGGDDGGVVLSWRSISGGAAAGEFRLTKSNYIIGEQEIFSPSHVSLNFTVDRHDYGSRVTVTRTAGSAGKVYVGYQVASALYTNIFETNYFVTNILIATVNGTDPSILTNLTDPNIISFTNIIITNVVYTNSYQNLVDGEWVYCPEPGGYVLTHTNENGVITSESNNFALNLPRTTCVNQTNVSSTANTNVPVTTTFVITNVFCGPVVITNEIVPAAGASFAPLTGSLEFDDFQMSQSFLVQQWGFRSEWNHNSNPALLVTLTEAQLDPLETAPIDPPIYSAAAATIEVKRFDIGAVPLSELAQLPSGTPCYPQDVIFNIERANIKVGENLGGAPTRTVFVAVERTGTNATISCSVRYRVDYLFPNERSQHFFNGVGGPDLLQAGSDFATPVDPFRESWQPADFEGLNQPYVEGILNWAAFDFQPKFIPIVINNDDLVEFNEDLLIQLWDPEPAPQDRNGKPMAMVGQVGRATMTILCEDLPGGSVDTSFNPDNSLGTDPVPGNPNPGANGTVFASAIQADGKTIIGGTFSAYNTLTNNSRVARLNLNGLLDQTFNIGSGPNGSVTALAIAPDGKIFIGGDFTSVSGIGRRSIARLNPDGSLDNTFKPQLGVNGTIWSISLQPDGKALIAGFFTSVNGTNRAHVARLNVDGSLDDTFDPGSGPNGNLFAVAVQPDGKILVGGDFTSVRGTNWNGIARLNSDGTLDSTFSPGSGTLDVEAGEAGIVYNIAVQGDGKILIGGAFSFVSLQSRNSIARLNANGTLDTTFDPGSGADHVVYAVKLQNDGRVLIGGVFTSYNGTRRVGVARLFSDGSLDTTFMDTAFNQFAGVINPYFTDFTDFSNATNPIINTRNTIFTVSPQNDGHVIVGGVFREVGGGNDRDDIHPRQNVARLIGDSTPGPGNIGLVYDNYTAGENNTSVYVTLMRTNGTLGPATATFRPVASPAGPGAAVLGTDFSFDTNRYGSPTWVVSWPRTWMLSDGISGQNNNTPSVISNLFIISPLDDVRIDLLNNAIVDGNKSLNLEVTLPSNADNFFLGGENIPLGVALGRTSAPMTIIDDDVSHGKLGFSAPTYTIGENGTNAELKIFREEGSFGPVIVTYIVTPGTATAGLDYLPPKTNQNQNVVNFLQGETNKSIFIPIINDTTAEFDETFNVFLTVPTGGATLNTNATNAVVTIVDNDFDAGRLSFTAATFATNESKAFAVITVARTNGNVGSVSVQCAATDGTATNGFDFLAVTNTLFWADGETSLKTLIVPILSDSLVEGNETVNLRLFDPIVAGVTNNTALGQQSNAVLVIEEDDFYGDLRFSVPNFLVNENGGSATITVLRVGGTAEPITIRYTTLDGTATNGLHYTTNSGLLNFAAGQVSATFSVAIIDDFGITNDNRVINLVLSDPTPGGVVFQTNATLTIIDNETINEISGTVDTSFYAAAGVNDYIYSIALQSDGKLLFGGDFTEMNKVPRNRIGRLNTNGTLDTAFSSILPTAGVNGSVRSIITQTDGRILIGGLFTSVNGNPHAGISRLNLNGSSDSIFNPGAGADSSVYALAETFVGSSGNPDNRRILVAGRFTSFDGTQRNGIVRLLNNGRVDGAFDPGSGVNGTNGAIHCMAVQVDGKVIIGGDFISFNNQPAPHIARLNVDGSLDLTFNPGVGPNHSVRAIAIQPDGKLVIGGLFTNVAGGSFNHIARLNPNGSVDNTFTPGIGANDSVYAIALQVDGKILLGGEFTQASGVTRNRLTRLNADGTVDPSINFGTGADSFVAALAVQPDGKIVLAGGFMEFDGVVRPRLARIHGGSMNGNGKLEFVSSQFEGNENGTNVVITVRRKGSTGSASVGPVFVNASTSNGSAEEGLDYIGSTNILSFPVGETRQNFTIPIINDDLVEASETVNLTLSNPTDAALGEQPTATLTIYNDDAAISFSSANYGVAENVPNGNAIITIVRTGSSIGTASVNFFTGTNGTATPDVDFGVVTNMTITFEDGETSETVMVPLLDDASIEGDETVTLQLSNFVGAVVSSPAVATLTIVDDDQGPGNVAFLEPVYTVSESGVVANVTVIRTNGSSGFISVKYATEFGTASVGVDYAATNGTLSFGPGELTKVFSVRILDDAFAEGNETVPVILSNPTGGAGIVGTNTVPLIIVDDEIALSFSTPSYVVNEGDGGATITVRRLSGTNGSVTVFYETADLTATNGLDYIGLTNSAVATNVLVFAEGETFKTFTVTILEDQLVEGDQTFAVRLFGPSGGAQLASPSNAVVTIVDNDSSLIFAAADYVVDESGTNVVVTVTRTNTTVGTATINFATSNITAVAGADFAATNGTLSFLDGENVQTIVIPIVDDASVEGDETFAVRLSNPGVGTTLGEPSVAIISITDNDAGFRFSSPTYSVSESGVSASITVLRTTVTNTTVTVNYSAANGTGTDGQDYLGVSGTLTFTNGVTAQTFSVPIIDDTAIEGDETVLLTLATPSFGSAIINPAAAVLSIMDNDGSLIVPAGSALISESGPANGVIDPSENVALYFAFRNTVGANTANLVATLLPGNGVTSPSGSQNYGSLKVGGHSVSRPFSFTASGTNGQQIMASFQLQDGPFNLGTATFTYTLGSTAIKFTNAQAIVINDSSSPPTVASPYPSTIDVTGVVGAVSKVTVTLSNLSHTFPDDIDILLVSPSGQKIVLMSDAGGGSGNPISNRVITFDDVAPGFLPDSTPISSGTYRPTDYIPSDSFPVPAPAGPYSSTLSALNGINPNGTWSLYVVDDLFFNSGSIAGGWSLAITTSSSIAPTADLSLTMSDSPDPAATGNELTYTLTVTNHGPSAATGIVITNILPASVTFISQTCECTILDNVLTCPEETMPKDSVISFNIVVSPNEVGLITNLAVIKANEFDPNLLNNTATAVTTVDIPRADLGVSIADSPDPVQVNNDLTYSIIVSNFGPAIATNVSLTNTLPLGSALQSAFSTQGTWDTNTSGVVVFNWNNLVAGSFHLATVRVRLPLAGTVTNIASAGSLVIDPFKANNTAAVKTMVELPPLDLHPSTDGIAITWGTNAPNYVIHATTNLSDSAIWWPVTDAPVVIENGKNKLIINFSEGSRFFRLGIAAP